VTAAVPAGDPGAVMERTAKLSDCGTYRYSLGRRWNEPMPERLPVLDLWVMLNPSTADAEIDDPTIRRCIAFSRSWGADGLRVVNLFALRSTDPAALNRHPDPIGPRNDATLKLLAQATRELGGRIVCAWGAHPMAAVRGRMVLPLLGDAMCLGTTKAGAPRHPLYVRGDTALTPWSIR
jgi:hypothetical protein